MKGKVVIVKNIFCIMTVVWSLIMLIEYVLVLLPFQLTGILLEIFDFFVIFLYSGILCVPVLFILSTVLIARVREKHNDYDRFKALNIASMVIPIFLAALMLLTGFNSRLQ